MPDSLPPDVSCLELQRAAFAGNKEAFHLWWRKCGLSLATHEISRILHGFPADQEEALQDTWRRLSQALPSLSHDCNLEAYLTAVAQNRAIDGKRRLRSSQRQRRSALASLEELSSSDSETPPPPSFLDSLLAESSRLLFFLRSTLDPDLLFWFLLRSKRATLDLLESLFSIPRTTLSNRIRVFEASRLRSLRAAHSRHEIEALLPQFAYDLFLSALSSSPQDCHQLLGELLSKPSSEPLLLRLRGRQSPSLAHLFLVPFHQTPASLLWLARYTPPCHEWKVLSRIFQLPESPLCDLAHEAFFPIFHEFLLFQGRLSSPSPPSES